jgi:hypothetical protein
MSSISIIQEKDKFIYAVDTALSCFVNNVLYRVRNSKIQKTFCMGKDVVFFAGKDPFRDCVRKKMSEFINDEGHINIVDLQGYLKNEYPDPGNTNGHSEVGVAILMIENGHTVIIGMKQGYNNYEIKRVDAPLEGINVVTDGHENVFFFDKIMEYNEARYKRTGFHNIVEDVLDAYRLNYSEGIGGEILLYSFDACGTKLLYEEILKETGLKYINKGINFLMNGDYVFVNINGYSVIHAGNINQQAVANASNANMASLSQVAYSINNSNMTAEAHMSVNKNFIPESNTMYVGSSGNPWAGVYALNATIQTSDQRKKDNISVMDDRYLKFAKMLVPKSFTMKEGTSGRTHIGFIAQEVEAAMVACGITDMEFAGLIKSPVYAKTLIDKDGKELPDYDITSEIIGYDYGLRYEEFIPLILLMIADLEKRIQ